MILLRQAACGAWAEAKPDDASGQIVYEDGERIAFRIASRHNAPVYASVLDFGLRGMISLLHPIEGASEQLAPGGYIEVGVREGDEIKLYLPDDFAEVPDPEEEKPRSGTETFKLFATSHEADFSALTHENYREIDARPAKGFNSPLGQLLGMALTGDGSRGARHHRTCPNEDWTTVERSFVLQEKSPYSRNTHGEVTYAKDKQ